MDLKYIEENNLNEARKRFQQINEYILNMNGEKHEAQEQPQDAGMNQQQPPMDNQQAPVNANAPAPQDAQQQMPPQQDDTQLDPTIGAEAEPANDEVGLEGEPEDGTLTEPAMESDEVIDVDDLTQSQETTEYKLDGVDDKLTQLIDIVSKFSQALEDNDEKINDLKKEIEERNPTQQERLNIRSMNGSPYNVSPQDYWSEQNARNPQYNVIGDNDVDPDKEDEVFTITDDDINNFNKDEIEKSINNFPKNLEDYFA